MGARYGEFIKGREDNLYPFQTSAVQRFFPVVGNHDTDSGSAPSGSLGGGTTTGYLDYFFSNPGGGPRLPTGRGRHDTRASYYDFYWGDIHMIMADSDLGDSNSRFALEQNQWIETRLRNSRGNWKFVVFHQPPYSSARHGEHEWIQGPHLALADAVFSAHDHVYERIERDGTIFFTSGLGGRPPYDFRRPIDGSEFRYNENNGALFVEVTPFRTTFEFRPLGGTGIDRREISKFVNVSAKYYLIDLIKGQRLTADIEFLDTSFDPGISLGLPAGSTTPTIEGVTDRNTASLDHLATATGRYSIFITSPGVATGDYRLKVTQDPPYPTGDFAIWRAQNFGLDPDESVSGDLTDADSDGLPVLLEYALGTDPSASDSGNHSAITYSDGRLILEFNHQDGMRDDLSYKIEKSDALDSVWETLTEKVDGEWTGGIQVSDYLSAIKVTLDEIPEGGSRFYRLSVSHQIPAP